MGDCLLFAGVLSFIFGAVAFGLPNTPPSKQVGNPLAFLEAVGMLRHPAFAVMAIVSFFMALEMQWYFIWSPAFLNGISIPDAWLGPVLTGGQIFEMVMMVMLPLAVSRLGFKYTMVVGIVGWTLRDAIFAIGQPMPLVIGAIALHGLGFAFFFTTIFMFADAVAPKDIKSSAQSFLASITFGCGMLVGSLLAGPVANACGGDWHRIYIVPAILCGLCCLIFLAAFRYKSQKA